MNSRNAYYLVLKTGISNLKLEKIISQDCHYSYFYAINVLNCRFELGEEIISKDCYYSFSYAFYVLKGRFELGEGVISQDWFYSCYLTYLYEVLGYDHE